MDNKTIIITVGIIIAILVIGSFYLAENAVERRSSEETKEDLANVNAEFNFPPWTFLLAAILIVVIAIIVTHRHFFVYEIHKIEAKLE